VSLDAQM